MAAGMDPLELARRAPVDAVRLITLQSGGDGELERAFLLELAVDEVRAAFALTALARMVGVVVEVSARREGQSPVVVLARMLDGATRYRPS